MGRPRGARGVRSVASSEGLLLPRRRRSAATLVDQVAHRSGVRASRSPTDGQGRARRFQRRLVSSLHRHEA